MKITIRKAMSEDIELLIALRLDYLREDNGRLCKSDENLIRSQLNSYFSRHIESYDFFAILGEVDGEITGSAFLTVCEKPANLAFMNGKTGTVLNVLTYPKFRRQGVATMVISALIEEAKAMDVSQLDLYATAQGKPLYEKFGFAPACCTAMRLKLV